jgi:hypothetical protein
MKRLAKRLVKVLVHDVPHGASDSSADIYPSQFSAPISVATSAAVPGPCAFCIDVPIGQCAYDQAMRDVDGFGVYHDREVLPVLYTATDIGL